MSCSALYKQRALVRSDVRVRDTYEDVFVTVVLHGEYQRRLLVLVVDQGIRSKLLRH